MADPKKQPVKRKTAARPTSRNKKPEPFSAGSYTYQNEDGSIALGVSKTGGIRKQAILFGDGGLGSADIADSQNIGYYNFEFPVDSLELPQSRKEELKFYRLSYDRDPIVSRAIDLHTELPMSKMILEKPKSSSEAFTDYIYDFYQALVSDTELFDSLLQATKEYWLIGEAFLYVEDSEEDVPLCEEAAKQIKARGGRGEGGDRDQSSGEGDMHPANGIDDMDIIQFINPAKSSRIREAKKLGLSTETESNLLKQIRSAHLKLKTKIAKVKSKVAAMKIALPGDEADKEDSNADAAKEMRSPLEIQQEKDQEQEQGVGDNLQQQTSPDSEDPDLSPTPEDDDELSDDKEEIADLQKLLVLLEKKKELLSELKVIREAREHEYELFSHIVNKDYSGWSRIQMIPPDRVEIRRDARFGDGPVVFYEPSEFQKEAFMKDPNIDKDTRDVLETDGKIPLNQDPLKGSFLIHFARKKAPYEDHGRSILQRCLRTVIYRDKLRQVQTTIVSRNMTPKTLVVAPDISSTETMALRAHIDEAKSDPDYTIVVNYDATWNEIGSEGRILALDSEWTHTNADLSTGLGFSPDLLTGEGFYSGNRIHLELLNTTYVLYRETISNLMEKDFFKPIAMKKGFFELDNYNRPRWIYPKINFSRLALRDSGDVYEMLFNLYSKGAVPIEIIYEFLNIDPETCRRKLEEDLFTVNDSKFNQLLDSIYGGGVNEQLLDTTDLKSKIAKGLRLEEKDSDEVGLEGSGEGV
jgi:hypothetical protein